MFTYTQCRDCGGLLHTTDGDTVHPGCTPKPSLVEELAAQWLTLAELDADPAILDPLQQEIDEIDGRPPRMLAAALKYASWGWPVFPLKVRAKTPATRNGFKDATTDSDRIHAWWQRHPDSNIGLPTGHRFDVIDVDVPSGAHTYTQLRERNKIPDIHGHVATSSGGLHLYVLPSGDGNKAGVRAGIDYRGIGGYVVAPPSTLGPRGRAWTWAVHPSPMITGNGDTYGKR